MTDLNDYPSGTIIAINYPETEAEAAEWFVRIPDHLIPPALRETAEWMSLADGARWTLADDAPHDVVAFPRIPRPTPDEE